METLFDKNSIILDGKMDEPVWESVPAQSNFRCLKSKGGAPTHQETFFKMIPCEDRIYVGIYCADSNVPYAIEYAKEHFMWISDAVEVFLSPAGIPFEFYQFSLSVIGQSATHYYSEGGNIEPDPYAPDWSYAVYTGDTFWSAEIEIPLTAFYMTAQDVWNTDWLVNICRTITSREGVGMRFTSSCELTQHYKESENYRKFSGFPMRPEADDLRISSASVALTDCDAEGFTGTMQIKTESAAGGDFILMADNCEEMPVTLQSGVNVSSVPCRFAAEGRQQVSVQLKRVSDGKIFKRSYPVRVVYEPIRLMLTLPEYRGNFYPGQDATKVSGKVEAAELCTLTLEGPGIPTMTVTPDEAGNFSFDTPNFEIGDALLTIKTSKDTLTKKIRRLAPSEHTMTWISGGNLIKNGKPTLRRTMYAAGYRGGAAFRRRYDADDLHQTPMSSITLEPARLIKGADAPGGEATLDARPSEAMLAKIQKLVDAGSEKNFDYYYLSDEPECRGISPVYLKYIYDYVTEQDPYHVFLSASRTTGDYVDCIDWVECHPYIDVQVRDGKRYYGRPMNTLSNCIEEITSLDRSDKCIGFLPTCFSYKYCANALAEYPNFEEMVCHIWAALLAGAKTLWPYAYHDLNDRAALYEGIRFVNSGIEALEEFILLGARTELYRTEQARAVRFDLPGEKMFCLVNFTTEPQTVTLDSLTGSWYNFRRGGELTGNTFALKPLEVIIGTSEIKDAGLPTYEETAALIDKLEYERTHTGSLYFDRSADIRITPASGGLYYKLFDGVRDNWAWECSNAEGKTFAMDLSKVKLPFTKLVVCGHQIDNMELQFLSGGEYTSAPVEEIQTEEFSNTYLFSAPVNPDGLQLVFHRDFIELYEIEAF